MMHRIRKLFREIHRRSVWQVLGVFAVMSWGVLNAVDFLTVFAGLPAWTPQMAFVLLLIGLPIVTATAVIQKGVPGLTDDPHDTIHPDDVVGKSPEEVHRVPEAHPMHGSRLFTWRNAILGGVMAGALLVTTVTAYVMMWAMGVGPVGSLVAQGVLDERDPILLTQFANRTDDMSLGAVVTEALSVDLGGSRMVRLASDDVISRALDLMDREPGATVTAELGREIALREGIKATIEGEVSRVGSRYLLAARVVDPSNGTPVASLRETATDDDDLLPAIDRLSERLRERLGESLRDVRQGAPLAQVTTASLEALRKYTEAGEREERGDYVTARQLLQEAVVLDTAFAMAHRKLAVLAFNTGDADAIAESSTRAYGHRDRLTEVERYLAEANYHGSVTRLSDSVVAAYRRVLAENPDHGTALNNLGNALFRMGDLDGAGALYERAAGGPGVSAVSSFNVVRSRIWSGDPDGAEQGHQAYEARYPDHLFVPWSRYLLATIRGSRETIHEAVAAIEADGKLLFVIPHAPRYMAAADLAEGRVREAAEHLAELSPDLMAHFRFLDLAGSGGGAADVSFWLLDLPERVPGEVEALMATIGFEDAAAPDRLWEEPIIALARAGQAARARSLLDRWIAEVPDVGPNQDRRDAAWAAVLAAEGDVNGALARVHAAENELRCERCLDWVAAPILEQAGRIDEAIFRWERVRDKPMDIQMLLWGRLVANKRLGALYEEVGDTASAIAAYRYLVDAWAEGDPELRPQVAEARIRIAALSG